LCTASNVGSNGVGYRIQLASQNVDELIASLSEGIPQSSANEAQALASLVNPKVFDGFLRKETRLGLSTALDAFEEAPRRCERKESIELRPALEQFAEPPAVGLCRKRFDNLAECCNL